MYLKFKMVPGRDVLRIKKSGTLDAAAFAECGDFPRAVTVAKEAYRRSSPPTRVSAGG